MSKPTKAGLSWKDEFSSAINTYEFETVIHSTGQKVKFKPVDTNTLKKLIIHEKSDNLIAIENVFDELITNTIIEPKDIDIDGMLLFDRQTLLMDIRSKSKGGTIQQPFTCEKCKSQSIQTVDLNKMSFKDYVEPENCYIEIINGIGVQVGHVTRKHQKDVYNFLSNDKSIDQDTKEAITPLYVMGAAITAYVNREGVNTDLSFEDKIFMLEKFPDTVLEKMKDWLSDNTFGYEIKFNYICPHCGTKEVRELPVDAKV